MKFIHLLFSLTFWCFTVFGQYEPRSQGELVSHTYYTLGYNAEHKQAEWVFYPLDLAGKELMAERSNNFRVDKSVPGGSAVPADYQKSGYDRGHLCPAADMAFNANAMNETFYMSNMSPQLPSFNRGVWKKLEEKVRYWGKREKIYVVTGPVFKNNKERIGRSKVTVPGYFYKVVYAPVRQEMIAFILPNERDVRNLPEYTVTVDSLELLTGIDFFPQLPDSLQSRLERESYYNRW